MNPSMIREGINHSDAEEVALERKELSNWARCYLDMKAQRDLLLTLAKIIESTGRLTESLASELRAAIVRCGG